MTDCAEKTGQDLLNPYLSAKSVIDFARQSLRAEHCRRLDLPLQPNHETAQPRTQQQQRTGLRSWGCGNIDACSRKRFAKGIEHSSIQRIAYSVGQTKPGNHAITPQIYAVSALHVEQQPIDVQQAATEPIGSLRVTRARRRANCGRISARIEQVVIGKSRSIRSHSRGNECPVRIDAGRQRCRLHTGNCAREICGCIREDTADSSNLKPTRDPRNSRIRNDDRPRTAKTASAKRERKRIGPCR
jgi:hypothetical protein